MHIFKLDSIFKRLTLLVLVAVLPAMGILLYTGMEQRKESIAEAKQKMLLITTSMAEAQRDITSSVKHVLSTLALMPEIQSCDIPACRKVIQAVLRQNPNYLNIALTDLQGNVVVSGKTAGGGNLADRKHVQDALQKKRFAIGEFIVSRIGTSVTAFAYAYPVLDQEQNPIGVLTTIIKLESFSSFHALTPLPANSFVAVTDHKGIRLFYYPPKEKTNPIGKPIKGSVWQKVKSSVEQGDIVDSGSDGIQRRFTYQPIRLDKGEEPYMYVWTGIPEKHILAPANFVLTRNFLFLLLATLSALVIAWFIGRRTLIRPIQDIVSLTRKYADGKFEARTEYTGTLNEFDSLINAFHDMADAVTQSHKTFRENEARFRLVMDSLDALVYVADMETYELLFLNKYGKKLFGDVTGSICWQSLQDGQTGPCSFCTNKYLLDEKGNIGDVYRWEFQNTVTGQWFFILDRAIVWVDGRIVRIEIATDITDRKKAEATLRHRTQGLNILLETSTSLAATLDLQSLLQKAVEGLTRLVEFDTAAVYLLEKETLRLQATTPSLPPDSPGEMRVAHLHNHPHIRKTIESGDLIYVPDITTVELSPAEKEIVKQRNLRTLLYLPLIVESNVIGAFIVGSVGKVIPLSETDIDLSSTLANLVALTVRNAQFYEQELLQSDQLKKTLEERERAEKEKAVLESQLRQAHKMEAIGTLTGGIAHDFNNILAIILGNAEMAGMHLAVDQAAKHNIEQILSASNRAKKLVQRLLTFSRQERGEKEPLSLCRLVNESIKIISSTIPKSVKIVSNLPARCEDTNDDCYMIEADPTQFYQLLMNLCINAVDAMDEVGTITISVEEVSYSDQTPAKPVSLKPGVYEYLSVADTGKGMDQEVVDRIFDPFFTTKEVGKGTGIGLSVVQGIIKNHEGYIHVDSEPGKGTSFHIYFPATYKTKLKAESETHVDLPGGNERILFVDDEVMLVSVGKKMLENLGYKVTGVANSAKALELFQKDPLQFDLVITDQSMPNIDGSTLAKQMLKIRPDIPIVMCTGFSSKVNREIAKEIGIREFAFKPLDNREIALLIRKVFDEA